MHHLLLVHHDPVRGFQDRLQAWIEVFDPLAVLALDELGDELHRPGAVERDERDDVLEAVGPRALDEITHAARFELEYRRRVGVGEHRVGVGIVERDLLEREIGLPHCADRLHRPVEDGERGEAEEVELHQADALDVLHVELRDRALGSLGRVERAEIGELARGDQHATRVHADVARETFELPGEGEQLARLLLGLFALRQARLHLACILQGDALAGLEGNELRQFVRARVAPFHDAPDVAHHGARGHRAEGRDLRDRLRPVLLLHVLDHPVAPALAEVDVEVGHRYTLRIQEALEQEVVAQGIQVGDAERVGDQRPGARAASRTDRHAVRFGPVDEVGDDEEVAGESHLDDCSQFDFEAKLVLLLPRFVCPMIRNEPLLQPILGLLTKIFLA